MGGQSEEALSILRSFYHRSVWTSDLKASLHLRLLTIEIAKEHGNLEQALHALRWIARVRAQDDASLSPVLHYLHRLLPMGIRGERLLVSHRSYKFWVREGNKRSAPPTLRLLVGHIHFANQYPEQAIKLYRQAMRSLPNVKLNLACALLQSAYRRTSRDPRGEVGEAMQLLKEYLEVDPMDPERCYNVARAMHSCGFMGVAARLYQRALLQPSPCQCDAAYGLHLIYRDSGSDHLASHILSQYISI